MRRMGARDAIVLRRCAYPAVHFVHCVSAVGILVLMCTMDDMRLSAILLPVHGLYSCLSRLPFLRRV
ncbi:hypothetical protein KCP71_24590 [Salmonella enterica subsp. enterica]|nr:hypothetical protein KCP71_24590 [Salmonella enterica subsp. enterica]